MNKLKTNRFWQIVYPILLYYLIYNLLDIVFLMFLGDSVSKLFCLMLSALCTIPFIYKVYATLPIVRAVKWFDKETIGKELVYIGAIVAIGVLLNVIFTMTGLVEWSADYERANATLYSGTILVKILANAIVIPFLEELLYRGIICGQLNLWYGSLPAIVISAICFGIMHFNMIQFLYAMIVGLALAWAYTRTKKLWVVFVAHGLTNLVVILYTCFA